MKKFYGTFMQKQATKDRYVEVQADTYELAHNAMSDHFGAKWAFLYSEQDFAGQAEAHGLRKLMTIHVTDYGHGSIEYRLL